MSTSENIEVFVKKGYFRKELVTDSVFTFVKDLKHGKFGPFITVKDGEQIKRIKVSSREDYIVNMAEESINKVEVVVETEEEAIERIQEKFTILDEMASAAIRGLIGALVVVGPPGVGKSYGVMHQLEKYSMFDILAQRPAKYEVITGKLSAIGLYCALWRNANANHVLVLDDCDKIQFDEDALSLLKGALNSSGVRRNISWKTNSDYLRKEGIPTHFNFKGSVIFITNRDYDNLKGKQQEDISALHSRCHFIDLGLDNTKDKLCRIIQIFKTGELFKNYDFEPELEEEIIQFMRDNVSKLREISMRTALKIADLTKITSNWKNYAKHTVMK